MYSIVNRKSRQYCWYVYHAKWIALSAGRVWAILSSEPCGKRRTYWLLRFSFSEVCCRISRTLLQNGWTEGVRRKYYNINQENSCWCKELWDIVGLVRHIQIEIYLHCGMAETLVEKEVGVGNWLASESKHWTLQRCREPSEYILPNLLTIWGRV